MKRRPAKLRYLQCVTAKGQTYFYARSRDNSVRIPLGKDREFAEKTFAALKDRRGQYLTNEQSALVQTLPAMVYGARQRAKAAGLQCDLTIDALVSMIQAQKYCCAVTRMRFHLRRSRNMRPFGPSVDRIKPGGDYTIGNVRLTTQIANMAMNAWGEAPLRELRRAFNGIQRERGMENENSAECKILP